MRKLKLSKKSQPRKRLIKNLVSSLILFEQITTTAPKAKALKSEMQSLISKLRSMDNEVTGKRYLASVLYGGAKAKAYDYKDSYREVKLYKLGRRFGDNAETIMVKLIKEETKVTNPTEKKDKVIKKK